MATFAFEFDMVNAVVNVTIVPTAGTTTGYYAFEMIAPTGVTFKSVSTAFFTSPAANADATTPIIAAYQRALPKDINDVVLYGSYQFRALYKQSGSYGDDDNNFSEALRTVTITKKYGFVAVTPNFGLNHLVVVDITDYGLSTVTSRLITGYVVGGITATSTSNLLTIAPINDYILTLATATTQSYAINATYSATAKQSVSAIISTISYIKNLPDTINAAKVLLDSYDDIFCSQNRRLNDMELAKYLQITSKLALIGAALHVSSSISSAVEAMKELELLVQ